MEKSEEYGLPEALTLSGATPGVSTTEAVNDEFKANLEKHTLRNINYSVFWFGIGDNTIFRA